jgi:hypothetical protein
MLSATDVEQQNELLGNDRDARKHYACPKHGTRSSVDLSVRLHVEVGPVGTRKWINLAAHCHTLDLTQHAAADRGKFEYQEMGSQKRCVSSLLGM